MIVSKASSNVLSSGGLQDTKTFQIRTNGHAFRMLSSGMYSDKIGAVVREIGCNASDAHIASGTPNKPIEVKLPNGIDPQFYIKDYGIGLGHEDVMGLYTTYFASTKQQSNEMTGAFGLGSKSPFSYTDNFSVTACKDGKRRIYSAHIGEDDTPTVALMHEEDIPKDDPWQSGVMVGFPVTKADASEFHKRAQQIYRFFPTPPNIIGGDPVKPLNITQDYTTFAFVKDLPSRIVAVMGGVHYPVEAHQLNLQFDDPFRDSIENLKELMLRVPIGAVQVAASREQLQFDKKTQEYLIDELRGVVQKVVADLEAKAAACVTWEDFCNFAQTRENARGVYLSKGLLRKCGSLDPERTLTLYTNHYVELPLPSPAVRQHLIEEHKNSTSTNYKIRIGRTSDNWNWANRLNFRKDVTIVYGHEDRATPRIKEAMRTGALSGLVVLICPTDPKNVKAAEMKAALQAIEDTLVGVKVLKLGDFIPPPLKKKPHSKKKANVFTDGDINFHGVTTKVTDVPATERVYIRLTAGGSRSVSRVHFQNGDIFPSGDYNTLCSAVSVIQSKLKLQIAKPVEIRISDLKRVDIHKRPDWVYFDDYLKEYLGTKEFSKTLKDFIGSYRYTVDLGSDPFGYRLNKLDFVDCMVWMKEHEPKWKTHFEPVLKKHDLLDVINGIHANSKLKSIPQSAEITQTVDILTRACSLLGVSLALPKMTGRDVSAHSKKLVEANKLNKNTIISLLSLYPNSFETIIDEVLTRGA